MFGRLVNAGSFKRWNGALLLVIGLPDGSPGTIRADATDVFGDVAADGPAVVLDTDGLRHLRALVLALEVGLGSQRCRAVRVPSGIAAGRGTRK
ncbi:MAG TPA: hypothetical protein VJS67_05665 [Pseudonocardiaceae bacterium]|nr:hypothetical protein [Pseudonocardiaceae bacterium]